MLELDNIDILAECIEAIEDGRLTLEECLAQYPQHRESLKALLSLAVTLRQSPEVSPTPAFRQNARQRLLKQLPRSATQTSFWSRVGQAFASRFPARKPSTLSWVPLLVLAVFLLAGGGLVYAADSSVPGDTLYGLDRSIESLQLSWVISPNTAVHLQHSNAQERLLEAKELFARGDDLHGEMAMEDYDNAIQAAEMLQQQNNPIINSINGGRPGTGSTTIITTTTPIVTPIITPTLTVTPTTTPTMTPTATATPPVTITPTMTATPTVTVTATFTPTATVTPTATLAPTVTPGVTATAVPNVCTSGNTQPHATTLANRYNVPYAEIMGWFCSGFGFGEIEQAYDLSAETGVAVSDIFALRASGMGWGQIRQQLQSNNNGGNNGQGNGSNGNNGQGNGNNGQGNGNNGQGNGNNGNNGQGNGNNGNNGQGNGNNGNNGQGNGNNGNNGQGNGNNGNNGQGNGNNKNPGKSNKSTG